jgi:tetratricopeptide (TPR) repeat protein
MSMRAGSLVFAAVLLGCMLVGCGDDGAETGQSAPEPGADRRLGALDPGYVGNQACAGCHADVLERYERTNHGRSLTYLVGGPSPGVGGPRAPGPEWEWEGRVRSPQDGLYYGVETTASGPVQHETLEDADGWTVHNLTRPAHIVIGSGNQTRSFLSVENGHLTQMPLTWYSVQERWGMSPGFADANDRFNRPIILQCLNCHSDRPVLESHTQNVYRDLPGAISCERCHGPGRTHVEERTRGETFRTPEDPSIMVPTNLERSREMAVCLQCHLAGVITYPDGEDPTTFRPGMALSENRTVHVPALQFEDPDWVGIDSHPIRLARSACFEQSEMTCLSCHAPHTAGDELSEDHYSNACNACHTGSEGGRVPGPKPVPVCSRPVEDPAEARTGDCVGCHMATGGTSDVPHVRFTDHWIRRDPGPPLDPEEGRPVIESEEALALAEVGPLGRAAGRDGPGDRSEAERASLQADALFHFYETMHRHPGYLPRVVEAGRRALTTPGEPTREGRLALARALLELNEIPEAREVLETATEQSPEDPWGHFLLGALIEERLGDPAGALTHLDRALGLQPRFLPARAKRAETFYALGRFDDALLDLEGVVEEAPSERPRSWFNLGILHLERGDRDAAESAFEEASRLDPFHGDAAVQLGTLRMARGDLEGAEEAFRRAVTGDPENPAAHGSLAVLHLENGRIPEGIRSLRRVLELDPDHPQAQALLESLGVPDA